MSYKKLEVWQLSRGLVIDLHKMTLTKLPKFELYEEGSQIRRSVKSVKSNIVEGYGKRYYKNEFIRHLIYAQGSLDETTDHLETLFETESLKDQSLYETLHSRLDTLGRKLTVSSTQSAKPTKAPDSLHPSSGIRHPASGIRHPVTSIQHPDA